jgi:hypothetical protein
VCYELETNCTIQVCGCDQREPTPKKVHTTTMLDSTLNWCKDKTITTRLTTASTKLASTVDKFELIHNKLYGTHQQTGYTHQ